MSLKPGIGSAWFKKYGESDIYDSGDFVVIDGKKYKTPRYYDKLLEDLDEQKLFNIKKARLAKSEERAEDQTRERLLVREKVQHIRADKLKRGYENS